MAKEMVQLPPDKTTIGDVFEKRRNGQYVLRLERGLYFRQRRLVRHRRRVTDSPLFDPLQAIGFDLPAIARILDRFQAKQIQVWADVTLAAKEHKGNRFFRRSPQAFFMDNIQNALVGCRTPPDWFHELRKHETCRQTATVRRRGQSKRDRSHVDSTRQSTGSNAGSKQPVSIAAVLDDSFTQFRRPEQSKPETRRNSRQSGDEKPHRGGDNSTT